MRIILSTVFLIPGVLVYLLPGFTRRGVLFAVPVAPDFRESPMGRRSIATFHAIVGCAILLGLCAILFAPESFVEPISIGEPIFILLAGGVSFAWQNRRLAPFAVQPSRRREVDVTGLPERLPWFTWLSAGPLAIIAFAALFLHANWARIPERFPTHWGFNGQPNRWTERSFHGVYGPLLFAAALCLWCTITALAMWFGARRSRLRRIVMGLMIGAEFILGFLFSAISVSPVLKIPIWIPILAPLVFFIPLLVVLAREMGDVNEAPDVTPNDRWKAGVIYYNPDDAALMVEKRTGIGYTFNFANPWSWAIMIGLVLISGSVFFLF